MSATVRVVVVDDHDVIRVGVKQSLGPEIEVVGEGRDVESAIAAILATICSRVAPIATTAAARSSRNVAAPIEAARRRRARISLRSKISGLGATGLSGMTRLSHGQSRVSRSGDNLGAER